MVTVLLVLGLVYLAWRLADILVVAFCALLFSILARCLGRMVGGLIGLSASWGLVLALFVVLIAGTAVFALFGAQLGTQFLLLARRLPDTVARLVDGLRQQSWGQFVLTQLEGVDLSGATASIAASVAAFIRSTLRVGALTVLAAFAGIYLSAQPEQYRCGLLRLVPQSRRVRAGEILDLVGATLERWLLAQSLTMLVIGSAIGIGLWALGVPSPFAFGVVAGLSAFVPYIGPLMAAIPALTMAATQGLDTAVYAAILLVGAHVLEGNLITPMIQSEILRLPPLLMLFAAAAFGVLLGPMGVVIAAPLAVALSVLVQALYIEDALGESRTWP